MRAAAVVSAPHTIVETTRLRLRELTPGDLDFVAEMRGDAEVMRYYPKQYTREESAEWIARHVERYRADGYGLWLVERRDTAQPIGTVGLVRQIVHGRPEVEIGYLIHRAFWRQGFATEAARACRDYAFGELHVPRVISLIRPENVPSQGVARNMGMSVVGEAEQVGFRHLVFAVNQGTLNPEPNPEPRT